MPWVPFAPFRIQQLWALKRADLGRPSLRYSLLVELAFKLGKIDELGERDRDKRARKCRTGLRATFCWRWYFAGPAGIAEAEALVRTLPETIKKDAVAGHRVPYLFYAYHTLGVELEQSHCHARPGRQGLRERAEHALFLPPISTRPRARRHCVVWSTSIGAIGVLRMRGARC